MKKPKKLSKKSKLPKLPSKIPFKPAGKTTEEKVSEALSDVPRITNETVTEHREEMLSSARKYIYPLQHSKRHIVRNSIAIFAAVVLLFFGVCALNLYKLQNTSGFIYDVSRIVPFPVAKVGKHWVSYESYLFELRRNMHYYKTQQHADFSSDSGRKQLNLLKQQAMNEAIQDAYVSELAAQSHVTVSDQDVTNEINLLRAQNRLGDNDRVFREVLNEFWGWNESDFRRALKSQLLRQAVVAKLDTATNTRAQATLQKLAAGADFAKTAKKVSDDGATKGAGGRYASPITPADSNIPPAVDAALFKLPPNQLSTIINTGYTLEIVKVLSKHKNNTSLRAAHIQFDFKRADDYINPLKAKQPPHVYIKISGAKYYSRCFLRLLLL
jgi:parvulin-like peptidyl-prolyl isomerase